VPARNAFRHGSLRGKEEAVTALAIVLGAVVWFFVLLLCITLAGAAARGDRDRLQPRVPQRERHVRRAA
jgi:hypothetical protein